MIPNFITACLDGRPPKVYGDGEQSRDFTFVGDVVRANLLAGEAEGVSGQAFNIAAGNRITINDLVEEVRAATGCEVEAEHEPGRPGDVRHSLADLSRAREELGYEPQTDLSEGLRLTVDALRAPEALDGAASGGRP